MSCRLRKMHEKKGSRYCRGRISVKYKILKNQTDESISLQSKYLWIFSEKTNTLSLKAYNTYFIPNDVQESLKRKQYDNITLYIIIGKPQKNTVCLLGEKLKQMEFLLPCCLHSNVSLPRFPLCKEMSVH